MAIRLIKNVIGILCIPLVVAVTTSFYSALTDVETVTAASRYFLGGLVAYVILYLAFSKMEYLYVLGHELVHALFVWLFGGRVLSFKVDTKGGSVGTTKSNLVIELGPYFVPFYTIIISLIYFVVSSFWQLDLFVGYFIFLVGFSVSFHIVMTIDKVRIQQPDLLRLGYLNSLILIYLVNTVVIGFFSSLLLPDFSFGDFFDRFVMSSQELYTGILNQLF
jgi:hypothetical protein